MILSWLYKENGGQPVTVYLSTLKLKNKSNIRYLTSCTYLFYFFLNSPINIFLFNFDEGPTIIKFIYSSFDFERKSNFSFDFFL